MRGKILQYNGNDGTGTAVVDGTQYRFAISSWKGDVAPAVGRIVEVIVRDGAVETAMPVAEDVLLREKTAELTGKLGSLVGKLSESGGGSTAGQSGVVERYGKPLLAAYGVFLLASLVLDAVKIEFFGMGQGRPLFDLASLLSQMGGGGGVKFLLILAYASIAVPHFWSDRRAWLALVLPLVAVLWGVWSVYSGISNAGGGLGGMMARELSDVISLGLGFYLSLISGGVIAAMGAKRFLLAA